MERLSKPRRVGTVSDVVFAHDFRAGTLCGSELLAVEAKLMVKRKVQCAAVCRCNRQRHCYKGYEMRTTDHTDAKQSL